jgi:hypothetical protein
MESKIGKKHPFTRWYFENYYLNLLESIVRNIRRINNNIFRHLKVEYYLGSLPPKIIGMYLKVLKIKNSFACKLKQ